MGLLDDLFNKDFPGPENIFYQKYFTILPTATVIQLTRKMCPVVGERIYCLLNYSSIQFIVVVYVCMCVGGRSA